MFLLLASSLHTGKRPGCYCPRGQRSQDAPKSLKEEQRGWIAEHDKEVHPLLSTHTHTHTRTEKNKNATVKLLRIPSACCTVIQIIIKPFRKWNHILAITHCTSWPLFSYPRSSCVQFWFSSAFYGLFHNLSHPKKTKKQKTKLGNSIWAVNEGDISLKWKEKRRKTQQRKDWLCCVISTTEMLL